MNNKDGEEMSMDTKDLISVENTTRVLEKFGVVFSHDGTVRLINDRRLTRLPRPFKNVSDSRFGFGVSSKSLKKYLLSLGASVDRINELL